MPVSFLRAAQQVKVMIRSEQGQEAHISTQHCPAVACIGNMQTAGMHQHCNGRGTRPGAFPCCAGQSAPPLCPFLVLQSIALMSSLP